MLPKRAQTWSLSVIYASPNETLHQSLWRELSEFYSTYNKPWLLAGNFNETKTMDEHFNYSEDLGRRCNNFILWIENKQLLDLGFFEPWYTWASGTSMETRKYAHLNRWLCNEQWRIMFEEAIATNLERRKSAEVILENVTYVEESSKYEFSASVKGGCQDRKSTECSLLEFDVGNALTLQLPFSNMHRRIQDH
ncbi:hypothetical protein Cgig2_032166 [Carnegiea gigantea]|uniref:Endonuclease/exonuclease/phosphatase domain-containing protein n=1 Tax=Carnegiea gigantea TaxID=171969 RepID=A0A9Q1QEE5_9CARY|nr:hypothetical protein Cgig2_032166 [Carnegiea gigantea]